MIHCCDPVDVVTLSFAATLFRASEAALSDVLLATFVVHHEKHLLVELLIGLPVA
jgi:uncharacterized RDD family membrane protein YckC